MSRRLSTLSLLLLSAGSVQAQATLLDQQPTRTFSLTASTGIQASAENFVIAGPDGVNLTQVTIWGTWGMSGTSNSDTFDLAVRANAPGMPPVAVFPDFPGTVLASAPGLTPTVTTTGNTMPTQFGLLTEYELQFTLPVPVTLMPDTYWIELYSTGSSGTGDSFFWGMAAVDPLNGVDCVSWSSATPGTTWNTCVPFPATDFAAVFLGEPLTYPTFCNGDGGDGMGCTDCPCGNNAAPGTLGGCLNSSGTSAGLLGSGLASVTTDSLRIEARSANLSSFGLLASADNLLPNMGPCPAGSGAAGSILDGLRCAGGAFLRHGTRATDANGDIGVTNGAWGPPNGPAGGLIAASGFSAGQTRHFQLFYRESIVSGCQTGQNTSNAVSVTMVP